MFINHSNCKIITKMEKNKVFCLLKSRSKMKGKILSAILLMILAGLALVSADIGLSLSNDLSKSVNTTTMTVTNNENKAYNFTISTPINFTDTSGNIISITPSLTTFQISNGTSKQINLSYSALPTKFNFDNTNYQTPVLVRANENISLNNSVNLHFINSFCDFGNVGSGLSITRVKDEKIDNEEAWEWKLSDNIEITVKVSNSVGDDIDGILDYGLYDLEKNTFIDLDEEEIDFSVDDGKSTEIAVKFQIPSDLDFDSSEKDYLFYVKAFEEGKEKSLCTDINTADNTYSQTAVIKKKTREIIIKDINVLSTALCGEKVALSAKLFNIGRSDEDKVKVTLINKDLGINLEKVINSLDSGDSSLLEFEFDIPKNATEKTHILHMSVYYDYDEDTESYDKLSDTDFSSNLKVENCVKPVTKNAAISAVLETAESDVKAGNDVSIKVTLKNTGSETTTYILALEGNELFSAVKSINPSSLTLEPGKSQDVLITLNLNKDAEGEYTFNVKTLFDNQEKKQPLSLSVGISGFSLTGSAIGASLRDNWFIWVIILINIILIVAIIVVAVRVSRG